MIETEAAENLISCACGNLGRRSLPTTSEHGNLHLRERHYGNAGGSQHLRLSQDHHGFGDVRLARASPRSTQLASFACGSVQLRSLAGASRGLIAVFMARAGLSP